MIENKILSYHVTTNASDWLSLPRRRYLAIALTPRFPLIQPQILHKITSLLESIPNHLLLLIHILISIDIVTVYFRIEFVFLIGIEDLVRTIANI
jgi:hypothetical protein